MYILVKNWLDLFKTYFNYLMEANDKTLAETKAQIVAMRKELNTLYSQITNAKAEETILSYLSLDLIEKYIFDKEIVKNYKEMRKWTQKYENCLDLKSAPENFYKDDKYYYCSKTKSSFNYYANFSIYTLDYIDTDKNYLRFHKDYDTSTNSNIRWCDLGIDVDLKEITVPPCFIAKDIEHLNLPQPYLFNGFYSRTLTIKKNEFKTHVKELESARWFNWRGFIYTLSGIIIALIWLLALYFSPYWARYDFGIVALVATTIICATQWKWLAYLMQTPAASDIWSYTTIKYKYDLDLQVDREINDDDANANYLCLNYFLSISFFIFNCLFVAHVEKPLFLAIILVMCTFILSAILLTFIFFLKNKDVKKEAINHFVEITQYENLIDNNFQVLKQFNLL